MEENLKSLYKKMNNILAYGNDGREHNIIVSQAEVKVLKERIVKLVKQLETTEEVAIEWQRKYEKVTGTQKEEEIDCLFNLGEEYEEERFN